MLLKFAISAVLACCLLSNVSAYAAPKSRIGTVDVGMCDHMRRSGVLQAKPVLRCDQLSIVRFDYRTFDGTLRKDGEIMVLAAVAPQVQAIFEALLARDFPIARARLMQHYRGDDAASMRDNNTSAFNDRAVMHGSLPSLHAYGVAIDINPVQNPYLQIAKGGHSRFSPASGSAYANRLTLRPGKPLRAGMAETIVDVFAEHGFFVWGGDWDTPIDYQHFQIARPLAEQLARLSNEEGRAMFARHALQYRSCIKMQKSGNALNTRAACLPAQAPRQRN